MVAEYSTKDVQSFERRSGRYERSLEQFFVFDRIHKAALGLIPQGIHPGNILDIGCGTGRLIRKAASRWPKAKLTGIDPSEGMISEARRFTPGAQFKVSAAEAIPFQSDPFDLVMSTMSFHHWADQEQALVQIADLLMCGGYFVLADQVMPLGLGKSHPSWPAGRLGQKKSAIFTSRLADQG